MRSYRYNLSAGRERMSIRHRRQWATVRLLSFAYLKGHPNCDSGKNYYATLRTMAGHYRFHRLDIPPPLAKDSSPKSEKEYKPQLHHTITVLYMFIPILRNSKFTGVPGIMAYLSQSGGCAGWIKAPVITLHWWIMRNCIEYEPRTQHTSQLPNGQAIINRDSRPNCTFTKSIF